MKYLSTILVTIVITLSGCTFAPSYSGSNCSDEEEKESLSNIKD